MKHRLFALCLAFASVAVSAQSYPNKPIRLVVPFATGGGSDTVGRLLAQKLSETLGVPVVVDNKPGVAGVLGTELVARALSDGYTLLLADSPHTFNHLVLSRVPYDPLKDFSPIALVARTPLVLAVPTKSAAKSTQEFIAMAKAQPGQMTMGSGGNGSTAHLSGELFRVLAKANMVHVPFKGAPAAAIGVMTGEISMGILNLPPTLPHVRSGKLKALGVSTVKRSAAVPEIPTIAEGGLPGYEASTWYALLAPAGTPNDIITRLNSELVKGLRSDDMKKRIAAEGGDIVGSTPEELTAVIKRDIEKWTKVVAESGAKAN